MSRPGFAADSASPESVVTPTAPNPHDDSSSSQSANRVSRHAQSAPSHQAESVSPEGHEPHKISSKSLPRSPTKWVKATPTSSLKRARTNPLDQVRRTDTASSALTTSSAHSPSPQLSERDSIFATHYLPSDSDASTPLLTPVRDVELDRSISGPEAVYTLRDARLSPPVSASSLSTHRPVAPAEEVMKACTDPIDDLAVSQTTASRPAPFRRASEVPSPSTTVTRLGSQLSWVRQQEPVESSKVAGKHRIAIRETFLPRRKVVQDGGEGDAAVPRDTERSLPPLLTGSSSSSSPSRTSHHVPSMVRPAFRDQERLLGEPWNTGLPHHKHGDVLDTDWETRVEHNVSRGRSTRVEESIEANLTNTDPSAHVRSRKSSHYMGLFKENTTSPERTRRDDRGAEVEEALGEAEGEGNDHDDELRSPLTPRPSHQTLRRTSDNKDLPSHPSRGTKSASDYGERVADVSDITSIEPVPEESQPRHSLTLPNNLLEEIRNFHLTAGGGRGSSFSPSIPTQIPSERIGPVFAGEKVPSVELGNGEDTHHPLEEQATTSPEEEDDEENEHISSALYFPHEPKTPGEVEGLAISREAQDGEPSGVAFPGQNYQTSPEPAHTGHVDISLRSRHDSNVLHGDYPPFSDTEEKPLATISEHSYDPLSDSEITSADESARSAKDEESSLTDDMDVTPTATPTQSVRLSRPRRKHHTQTGAIGAVELKPYRHQVGGHTTVFRFSRRAVCKQLNNRENEFYERIERRHPEMLMFLPRYIGVLNVTFSKKPKRSKIRSSDRLTKADNHPGGGEESKRLQKSDDTTRSHNSSQVSKDAEAPRIFSQQQVTGVIPKVILANNRHIIPSDLFLPPRPKTADGTRRNKPVTVSESACADYQGESEGTSEIRFATPALKRQTNSWGATTVNRKLQEQVLREVFSPPTIHRYKRRHHLSLTRNHSDISRRRVNLSEDTPTPLDSMPGSRTPSRSSPKTRAIDIVKSTGDTAGLSLSASGTMEIHSNPLEKVQPAVSPPRASSLPRDRPTRRRHSGSGLQRRRSITGRDGDLVFYEDDGYGGDREEDIFAMDHESAVLSTPSTKAVNSPDPSRTEASSPRRNHSIAGLVHPLPAPEPESALVPTNPKEAQTKRDDRVQFFILLEDLTAGMNKPCVLDLKMGTRQYGLDADEKKKKSQRRKCQTTTSQQLGVRLCGMQTWNVKKREYLFEDKYYGRDLKAGREFQDALTRFLYDGVSYRSVTKKIPIILEKLSKLESMIRRLKSYRFYASSLLILYDGDQESASANTKEDHEREDGRANDTKRPHLERKASEDNYKTADVQLKIVDFANCVTGEDELPPNVRCPPHHPDDVDRGYLRGLRSLRMYFQRILREVSQEDYVERGEGEVMVADTRGATREITINDFWDENIVESDPGEVST